VGSHDSGDCTRDTLTGEERCSLVMLLHDNCFKTNHPLLNCKYAEVVGVRANIYISIDDDANFIDFVLIY